MSRPVLHVTGARPNFPKAAPVLRALDGRGVPQQLVHTGQHYGERMSEVFFRQLGLPEPDVNLGVGSGTHAGQTAAIMAGLEDVLDRAAAAAGGGLRRRELHRRRRAGRGQAADPGRARRGRACAASTGRCRRRSTGWSPTGSPTCSSRPARTRWPISATRAPHPDRIHLVGNPMIDTLLANLDRFDEAAARAEHGLAGRYVVATLHRPANVDGPATPRRWSRAARGRRSGRGRPPAAPARPGEPARAGLFDHPRVRVIDPLGYVEFMSLVRGAAAWSPTPAGCRRRPPCSACPA